MEILGNKGWKFFTRLKLPFVIELTLYFEELGVQIVEHLKHLEKENWDFVTIEILELKFIQTRQLKTAVFFLNGQVRSILS